MEQRTWLALFGNLMLRHTKHTVWKEGGEVGKEGGDVGKEGGEVGKEGGEVGKEGGEVKKEGGEVWKEGGEVGKVGEVGMHEGGVQEGVQGIRKLREWTIDQGGRGGRKQGKEVGRKGRREGGREGGREEGKEGRREGGSIRRPVIHITAQSLSFCNEKPHQPFFMYRYTRVAGTAQVSKPIKQSKDNHPPWANAVHLLTDRVLLIFQLLLHTSLYQSTWHTTLTCRGWLS